MTASDVRTGNLRDEIAALEWYHTLELAPGVTTPGWFDTRSVLPSLPIPRSLEGKRCLDVGTFDGFWAFSMERRGAREVVAIDLLDPQQFDWPPNTRPETVAALGERKGRGEGFEVARRCLGSSVVRHELSVYDASPGELGTFDFIYVGSLLLHLRDPVRALERLRSVCAGELLLVDSIDLLLTLLLPRRPAASLDIRGRPWWWTANVAGIARMAKAAGFRVVEAPRMAFMPPGEGQPLPPIRPRMMATRDGRETLVKRLKGDPHAVIRLAPG